MNDIFFLTNDVYLLPGFEKAVMKISGALLTSIGTMF